MADSISVDGASAAYCSALLKSDGRLRMPWKSGSRGGPKGDDFCASAVADSASRAAGAKAPVTILEAVHHKRYIKAAPRQSDPVRLDKVASVLWSARCSRADRNLPAPAGQVEMRKPLRLKVISYCGTKFAALSSLALR